MKLNLKKFILLCFVVFLVAFLLGFILGNQENNQDTNSQQTIDNLKTIQLKQAEPQTFEIQTNGYTMNQFTIQKNNDEEYKNQQLLFKQQQDETASQHYFDVLQKEQKNDPKKNEQDRIKKYCLESGYFKCIKITETCDKDQCYSVNITCTDNNFDVKWLDKNDPTPDEECHSYHVEIDGMD